MRQETIPEILKANFDDWSATQDGDPGSPIRICTSLPVSEPLRRRIEAAAAWYGGSHHGIEYLVTCDTCLGAGFEAKLYPSGHTEIRCEGCNGKGYVDSTEIEEPCEHEYKLYQGLYERFEYCVRCDARKDG